MSLHSNYAGLRGGDGDWPLRRLLGALADPYAGVEEGRLSVDEDAPSRE